MKLKLFIFTLVLVFSLCVFGSQALATDWYSQGTVDFNSTTNWNDQADGSGNNMSDTGPFISGADNFFVRHDASINNTGGYIYVVDLTINGSGITVTANSGCAVYVTNALTVTDGTLDFATNDQTLLVQNSITVNGGILSLGSGDQRIANYSDWSVRGLQGVLTVSSGTLNLNDGTLEIHYEESSGTSSGNVMAFSGGTFNGGTGTILVSCETYSSGPIPASRSATANINATSALTLNNLTIQGVDAGTGTHTRTIGFTGTQNITISGVLNRSTKVTDVTGTNLVYDTGSTLNYNTGSEATTVAGEWPSTVENVTLSSNVSANVTLPGSSNKTVNGVLTLEQTSGELALNSNTLTIGGSGKLLKKITGTGISGGTVSYNTGGDLEYSTSGNVTIGIEWPTSNEPTDVTIAVGAGNTLTGSSALTALGNLTLTSGDLTSSGGVVSVTGNLSANGNTITPAGTNTVSVGGNVSSALTLPDGKKLVLNGTAAQSIGGSITLDHLQISNTSATVTANAGITFSGTTKTLTVDGSAILDLNGQSFGTVPTNLTIGSGGKVQTGGTDLTSIGTISASDATIVFDEGAARAPEDLPTNITIGTVEIDNPSGVNATSGILTINNQLTFTNGTLTTSASNVIRLDGDATVGGTLGTSRMVIGPLQKEFSGTGTFTYPVGISGYYRSADISVSDATNSPVIEVQYSQSSFTAGTLPDGISEIDGQSHYLVNLISGDLNSGTYDFTGMFEDGNFSPEMRNRLLVQSGADPNWTVESVQSDVDDVNNTVAATGISALPTDDGYIAFGSGGFSLTWDGPSGGYWNVAGNWNPDYVPTSTEDVTIGGGNVVYIDGGTAAVAKTLTINGTLEIKTTSTATSPLTIHDTGATALTVGAGATLVVNNSNGIKFGTGGYDATKTSLDATSGGPSTGSTVEYGAGTIPQDDYYHLTAGVEYLPTNIDVDYLEVDKTDGVLTTTGTLTVNTQLIFTDGVISTSSTKILQLGSGATTTGEGVGKFVAGPLEKVFTSQGSFTYPLGSGTAYRPAIFDYSSATFTGETSIIEIEYSTQTFSTGTLPAGISEAATEHYIVNEKGTAPSTLSYTFTGQYEDAWIAPESRTRLLKQTGAGPNWSIVGTSPNETPNTISHNGNDTALPTDNGYFAFGATTLVATEWVGTTDSDWATASNWNPTAIPTTSTAVTINSTTNQPVIADGTNAACKSLTISNNTLTISDNSASGTATLNIQTEDLTLQSGGKIVVNNTGGIDFAGLGTYDNSKTAFGTGSEVEYQGNYASVIPADTYHHLTLTAGATAFGTPVVVNGNLNINNAGVTLPTSVTFSGSGDQSISGSHNYATNSFTNMIVNKSGGTLNCSSDLVVSGAYTHSAGAANYSGPNGLSFTGTGVNNFTVNGGTISGHVSFDGSGVASALGGTATASFDALTINNGSGVTFNTPVEVSGNYTNTQGTVTNNNGLTVNGDMDVNGGSVSGNVTAYGNVSGGTFGGTVLLTGGNAQTIQGLGYTNVTVNKSSDKVKLAGNTTVGNTLTLTKGLVDPNSNTLSVTTISGGNVESYILGSSLTLNIPSGTGTHAFPLGTASVFYGAQLEITGSHGSAADVTVSFSESDGGSAGTPPGDILTISQDIYWTITSTASPDYNLSLAIDAVPNWTDASTLRILKSDDGGSTWTYGSGASYGSPYLTETGLSGFSRFTLGSTSADNPLPVDLVDFRAEFKDKKVVLSWATASEYKNAGFNILRSKTDDPATFEQINLDLIPGAGSSSDLHEYSFEDTDIEPYTMYYYKLIDVEEETFNEIVHITITVVTGSLEDDEIDIPHYYVSQNYPNPFNPETTIEFGVAPEEGMESEHVRLYIYDLSGRLIKKLVDRTMDAGSYDVIWDGTNDSGKPVPSGVYLYRLNSGNRYEEMKRMIMLK